MAAIPTICNRTGPHNLWLKDADILRVGPAVSWHQLPSLTDCHSPTLSGSVLQAENTKQGHNAALALKISNYLKCTGSQPFWVKGSLENKMKAATNILYRIDAPLSGNFR